jgi:hypothetical protein
MKNLKKIGIRFSGIKFNATINYDSIKWEHRIDVELVGKHRNPKRSELLLIRKYLQSEGFICDSR